MCLQVLSAPLAAQVAERDREQEELLEARRQEREAREAQKEQEKQGKFRRSGAKI